MCLRCFSTGHPGKRVEMRQAHIGSRLNLGVWASGNICPVKLKVWIQDFSRLTKTVQFLAALSRPVVTVVSIVTEVTVVTALTEEQ